jgi:hypothetical protein
MGAATAKEKGGHVVNPNLDTALHPYAGPCAFCGRPDARHRVWDAIKSNAKEGGTSESIAWAHNLSVEQVEWIIAQKKFPMPSRKMVTEWKERP